MRKFQLLACAFATALFTLSLNACSDDDPVTPDTPETPEDPETPETPDVEARTTHFDIWVGVGGSGGMGAETSYLVKSLDSLTAQPAVDFVNDGVDVTATMHQESIIKGKYYYQVPVSADRFSKYQIVDNQLQVVAEQPFVQNTFKDRRYTHVWSDDNTLIIIAANGSANKIIWTKLNASDMTIIAEGELSLVCPEGDKFSTSGLARYRKSDDRIIYFYQHKNENNQFYAAFINEDDMSVEVGDIVENRAAQMAGTAYGELLQNKMFFDDNDNLYLACSSRLPNATSSTQQYGRLLRVNNGEMAFDQSYEGYRYDNGKLVTVDYLGNNKALLYIQDPDHTGAGEWGSAYNCYYALLDLATDERTELECEGAKLPYCEGTFSQRSLVDGDVAYIGVNPENGAPCIYIYDITTGNVTKGLEITEGYDFNRIVLLDNADTE